MKIVKPNEQTTLLLDQTYMPFGIGTAKAVLYHMMKHHGKGLDASHVPFDYDDAAKRPVSLFEAQPVMRSAPNHITGEETVWIIPSVFVTNWRFYYKGRKQWTEDNLPPLKDVFDFYNGICQKCLRPVKFKDASRDHWKPKALGGGGGFINITLMHKDCNSNLGHVFPKFNDQGEEIVPKMKMYPNHFVLPSNVEMRKEWKQFLFLG